jgi:predicted negative regulator of RcsB-dependent stress response
MDEFTTDREQEERLRTLWRDNWRWALAGIVLGVGALIGFNQWKSWNVRQNESAATTYTELQQALAKSDHEQATRLSNELAAEKDDSPYVDHARLLLAKTHVEQGRFEEATKLLRSVVDQSEDEQIAALARLRLARVLTHLGKHDEALAALTLPKDSRYEALAHEVRGDIHYAKGNATQARTEYMAALAGDEAAIDRPLLELKLQQVGGAPETVAAKALP